MKTLIFALTASLTISFAAPAFAQTPAATPAKPLEPIEMAGMEILPFLSDKLPLGGAASFATKEIYKSMGYDLTLKIYPARRGRAETLKNPSILAFMPCSTDEHLEGLVLSNTVYKTTTVLIENKENPLVWSKPEDLAKYKGSIALGFSLREQIRTAYGKGKMSIEESPDDVSGILKVANKRVDYLFITEVMYKYLVDSDPRLKEVLSKIQVNARPVANMDWGVCFKKDSPKSMKMLEEFNKTVDASVFNRLVGEYVKKMKAAAAAAQQAK